MTDIFPLITMLAVVLLGQGRPFVEFSGLRREAQQGRELTAEQLLKRFHFHSLTLGLTGESHLVGESRPRVRAGGDRCRLGRGGPGPAAPVDPVR